MFADGHEVGSGWIKMATWSERFDEARAAWPAFQISLEQFTAYLKGLPDDERPRPDERACWSDLYLAAACAAGDAAAVRALSGLVDEAVSGCAAKLPRGAPRPDDLRQLVLGRLVVDRGHSRPRIASFAGQSRLSTWLRVVVTRTALNAASPKAVQAETANVDVLDLLRAGDDPELDYMKQTYGEVVRSTLRKALAALPPQSRAVLQLAFLENRTIDAIGESYGVHRATAARWVRRALDELIADLRRRLAAELGSAFESVVRLVQGSLEVSFHALASGEGNNPPE